MTHTSRKHVPIDTDRIDPDRWRPLMMSFQQFYGLGDRVHASRLGEIPESSYRKRAPDARRESA